MTTTEPIKNPLAFGWYFVDLLHEDGSRFTVAVHGANGFALPRRASVIVWHYRDGAKPRMWVAAGGPAQLPSTSMLRGIRNDIAQLRPTPAGWQLHVSCPQMELTVEIEQQLPLWRPSSLPFPLRLESDTACFDWVVACPHGRGEGRFRSADFDFPLRGEIYMDINFGALDVAAELDWWKWSTVDLAPGERVVASNTKWRGAPAACAAIHVSHAGVREMSVAQVQQDLGLDLGALELETPTAPALPLASELDLSVLGGRLGKYRRWSGQVAGKPAVLALLNA